MWSHTYTHPHLRRPRAPVAAAVDGWVRWNDGIATITLRGPVAVGTTFEMTSPGEEQMTSTIVALEPPRLNSDNTDMEGLSIRVEHPLDPGPDGGTTIAIAITVTGDVPDEVAQEVGTVVSADLGDVMANLVAPTQRTR